MATRHYRPTNLKIEMDKNATLPVPHYMVCRGLPVGLAANIEEFGWSGIIGTNATMLVKKPPFIICPNNSGSMVLRTALSGIAANLGTLSAKANIVSGFHGRPPRAAEPRLDFGDR